ncbi:apyrase isoform X2 [Solanum stenotomum]|uniref:apyrase isoform X2 n=1 Tax=Solanum stenotomum TaxID=172797 RepID=UPI0020D1DBE2|nr:apyrase isoform X2 [Solanum stenotomum]
MNHLLHHLHSQKHIKKISSNRGKMLNQNSQFIFTILAIFLVLPLSLLSKNVDARIPLRRHLLSHESEHYAVIFDAGSTGSRVHVFRFDEKLGLLPIGNNIEYFMATEPGLSSYAEDPKAAANSLEPLLDGAEGVVPQELQSETPLELGATAGLRMLKGDAAEKILQAVRNLVKNQSTFHSKDQWVTILDGTQEGSYMWAAINYLLGSLGKDYKSTTATIDLGGGSVQMAYAISNEQFAKAPNNEDGEPYVQQKHLMSKDYNLYVHSYLNYGQLAGRAEIFKASRNESNPCALEGYDGYYSYGGVDYKVKAPKKGSSWKRCRRLTRHALKVNAKCKNEECTFNGVWNGGGGDGQKNIHASSFFYDIGAQVGIVDTKFPSALAKPIQYLNAAKVACQTNVADIKSIFPKTQDRNIPYLCMDLIYEYTLLVDGFGLNPHKEITVIHDVQYKNYLVGAAWPLGCAIDLVSSTSNKIRVSSS